MAAPKFLRLEEQKPLLERYEVTIKSDLGMGKYGFKYGTLKEIYNPNDLTDDMDDVELSLRLDEHRKSGNSLIAKLAYEDGVITMTHSSGYTLSVTERKEEPETPKPEPKFNEDGSRNKKYNQSKGGGAVPTW